MISRLTANAAVFATLAAACIGFAAEAQQRPVAQRTLSTPVPQVIVLPAVVVTGKRIARS
jgi:multisubunit Na+/H+ antiporter MnhC subunit